MFDMEEILEYLIHRIKTKYYTTQNTTHCNNGYTTIFRQNTEGLPLPTVAWGMTLGQKLTKTPTQQNYLKNGTSTNYEVEKNLQQYMGE